MRLKQPQRGSSHVIIIVALVVLLFGALGYIFWQNISNQPANDSENTQNTTQDSEVSQLEPLYLELSEVGIRIPYFASEDTFTASAPNEFGAVNIYSMVAADAGCTYEYNPDNDPAGSIGNISSYATDSEFFPGSESSEFFRVVVIGDRGYVLRSPQNTCGSDEAGNNPAGEAQEAAFLRFADQFEQLEAL